MQQISEEKSDEIRRTITVKEVVALLARDEGPTLEFKREMYHFQDGEKESREKQKHELIKDILALANGNSVVAGDKAYLIIGASNTKSKSGTRATFDVRGHRLNAKWILSVVNPACEPNIEEIECEDVEVEGKNLVVITIIPTPYLHETTKRLETPDTIYSERTVFVRHKEGIEIASGKERDAIARIKRYRFDESKNPPAIPFGGVVGAIIGGAIAYSVSQKKDEIVGDSKTMGVAGAIVGGTVGASIGLSYKDFFEIRSLWDTIPSKWRVSVIGVTVALWFFSVRLFNFLLGLLPKPQK